MLLETAFVCLLIHCEAGPCPACHQHSDVMGIHAMNCGSGGERISCHHNLRNQMYEVAVAAGLGPVKEARFLIPGDDSRPADVYIPQFAAGLDAVNRPRPW